VEGHRRVPRVGHGRPVPRRRRAAHGPRRRDRPRGRPVTAGLGGAPEGPAGLLPAPLRPRGEPGEHRARRRSLARDTAPRPALGHRGGVLTVAQDTRTRRLAAIAFGVLVLATFAAFFLAQRLKQAPPAVEARVVTRVFSPNGDGRADVARFRLRLRKADDVTVTVLDRETDRPVRRLATDRPVPAGRPVELTWDGRTDARRMAPDAYYKLLITLREQGRSSVANKRFILDTRPPTPAITAVGPGRGPLVVPAPAGDPRAGVGPRARAAALHGLADRSPPAPGRRSVRRPGRRGRGPLGRPGRRRARPGWDLPDRGAHTRAVGQRGRVPRRARGGRPRGARPGGRPSPAGALLARASGGHGAAPRRRGADRARGGR